MPNGRLQARSNVLFVEKMPGAVTEGAHKYTDTVIAA